VAETTTAILQQQAGEPRNASRQFTSELKTHI